MATATKTAPKNAPKAPEAAPKAKKKKKEKVAKVDYPGLLNDKEEAVRLEEWPSDHNPKAHKPLKRAHFKCESIWLFHQADQAEARAKQLREQAEEAKKLGGSKDAAKAKKLLTMLKKAEELKAQLAAAGIDVEELAASAS